MDDYSEGFWNGVFATVAAIMVALTLITFGILIGVSV